ncbi:hypothetical protein BGZ95_002899 [Linnemannia exigua]|uniref:F-box domain-containing protein n=1 Tax=Linnemannia exigua TaxID=604196 RepID=A0AAD4D5D0_9FUNG|nr:hypothetical protein BGZ95_002899 [Linnemannia exigua]
MTTSAPPPQQQLDSTNLLPVLPDDCIYEVFQHLSANDLANASKTCRSWNKLSEKNSLWQQLCLERWRTWPPPPPFSSYYDDQRDHNGVLHRSFDGMSLHHNQQHQRHYGSSNSQEDNYYKRKGGSSSTSSFSKYPSPLEKLPDMHLPSQWYSTSHPPYDLESWKQVYRERHEKDHIIRMLLDEMVEDSRNRMRHMDGIAGIGMGLARDVLENIIHGRNGEIKNLSRTFYAQKTLKRLQRGWVLDQWRGYRSGYQGFPVWQGCGLMSMFSDQTMELADLDRQFQELADEFLAVSPPIPAAGVESTGGSLYREDDSDGAESISTAAAPPVYVNSNNHYLAGIDRYSPGSFLDSSSSSGRISSSLFGGPATGSASNKGTMTPDKDRMQERIDETHEQYQRHYDSQVERMKDLIRFFTREKGFKGNTENYYDPFNSLIDKVLTRKVGIPISLCIVFAELAERVGIHGVELMGFPQHFMIRYHPLPPRGGHHGSPMLGDDGGSTRAGGGRSSLLVPPTFFLDLFHPPHRLLSTDEYEDYFTSLNIPQPPNVYRDLPTPPLEIFLRCLRNIILAVEQTGGAGRIGSDHQTSLYSGITQLVALHPIEEWGLYVLWLKYLSNFWPEDVGFVRTAIEDMELSDHRRTAGRRSAASPPLQQQSQRSHHTYVRGRGGLHAAAGSAGQYTTSLSTQETVKILRAHVRELEMADEAGDVGEIRRRRRPKVVAKSYSPLAGSSSSVSSPDPLLSSVDHHPPGQRGTSSSVLAEGVAGAESTASASSPTMDSHVSHAHHQYLRQNSISGEQQSGPSSSMNPMPLSSSSVEGGISDRPRVATVFGGEERRRPEPEYYVGEVFRHLIYRYTECEAEEGWIRSMGIDMLSHGRHQPFYNALLNDGSKRYVAQENIQVLFREYRQGVGAGAEGRQGDAADQIPLDLAAMLSAAGATVVPLTASVPVAGVGSEEGNAVEESNSSSSETSQAPPSSSAVVIEGEATTDEENTDTMAIDPATDSTAAPTTPASAPAPGPTGTAATTPSSILSNMTFTVYNVEFSELGPLDIESVGQYFEAWDNKRGHYVMNKELRKVYPTEDYL